MIPVTRSSMPPFEEYVEEIKSLWDNRWLTNCGEKHNRLETELKTYLDAKNITLFTNGHLALETIIKALKLSGEIITTPFTFASTTQAIVRNGLVPVFCDISPIDFTIDTNKIESLITEKTSAILAVHVYGNICDVEKLELISNKYGLKIIYDAAHAFGEKYKNIGVGCFGDASMFSFHATKVFHTIEGGCVVFKNDEIRAKLDALKNFGQESPEKIIEIGGNAKMNEFQAAMGLCNLKHLKQEIEKREKINNLYRHEISDISEIYLPPVNQNTEYNYSYFPIVVRASGDKDRNALSDYLKNNGVMTRKYFYPLTNEFDCYNNLYNTNTPIAKEIAQSVLALPIYADLSEEDIDYICKLIKKFFNK